MYKKKSSAYSIKKQLTSVVYIHVYKGLSNQRKVKLKKIKYIFKMKFLN